MTQRHLTDEQKRIIEQAGTEAPFSGVLLHEDRKGGFRCAKCGNEVFSSDTKYDSGSGWPSFDQAIPGSVIEEVDDSHSMVRIAVSCASCGGHLGHVFDDGPRDTTGKRYCINSMSLDFRSEEGQMRSGAPDSPAA